MFCPRCMTEFQEGIRECPECKVPLVAVLPREEIGHEMDYVRVFETTDSSLLPVIESVLQGAGIRFVVQGEEALGVLPVGGFGSGARMHGLGASIHVPREQEAEVKQLLQELDRADSSEE